MGLHGLVHPQAGFRYLYDATPRKFNLAHLQRGSKAWKEAEVFFQNFTQAFRAEERPGSPRQHAHLKHKDYPRDVWKLKVPCNESVTSILDNAWYGFSQADSTGKMILPTSAKTPFMKAFIANATSVARLAAASLPAPKFVGALAIHMRFGDRMNDLRFVAQGQQSYIATNRSRWRVSSPVHVFSDDVYSARRFLGNTGLVNVLYHDGREASILQAVACMVAAEAFVGSLSDVAASAAIMRISLGKKETHMPSMFKWTHAWSDSLLTTYPAPPVKRR